MTTRCWVDDRLYKAELVGLKDHDETLTTSNSLLLTMSGGSTTNASTLASRLLPGEKALH
jgi:hypothetical protein